MTNFCSAHRLPRAGVDPINDPAIALALIGSLLSVPPERETFAILLDHERRGMSVLHLVDDPHPDAVFDVAELIVECAHRQVQFGAVILVSVRPRESDELADADRWLELSDQFEGAGIELVEWFVIGRTTNLPRVLVGDLPRWSN
jgi:hypothetical protein